MRLTFLGTRGNIKVRSRRHRMHTSLMVEHEGRRVVIDCGADWLGRLAGLAPHAVVVTHAHPDHAFGLRDGAPCAVYATPESWALMEAWPIARRRRLATGRRVMIEGIAFRAAAVAHSLTAPAIGLRIEAGGACVFYVPDVAHIPGAPRVLRGVNVYIGDGATVVRSMVWPAGGTLVGHAPIRRQLGWCAAAGVPRAVFTHCGTGIVAGDARKAAAAVRSLGKEVGVPATIARDGEVMEVGGVAGHGAGVEKPMRSPQPPKRSPGRLSARPSVTL